MHRVISQSVESFLRYSDKEECVLKLHYNIIITFHECDF